MKRLLLLIINVFIFIGANAQSDGCSFATSINMNTTCVPTSGTTTGATQTIAGCTGTADDDVWYQFTATANSVQIIVTAGDASFDPVVQLFSGGCSTLISLSCTDNGFGGDTEILNYNGLTVGQVYRVRIYHYYTGSGSGNFTICVKNAPPPPPNDACVNATALPVNTSCSFTAATTNGASESQIGCAGNADDDVWFSFVATNSVQNILVSPIDNLDLVFQVFEGSCGALNTLLCEDATLTGADEQSDVVGLTPGQTYFVRVYDYYGGVTGDFNICVTGPPTPAPINDEPCNAIALPPVTSECNYGFYTTVGATASLGAPTPSSCIGGSGAAIGGFNAGTQDVWFSVTVPSTGSLDIIPEPNGGAGTITDGVMVLYTGTCNALTQVVCSDDHNYPGTSNDLLPLITATGLTPGSTVFIRYFGFGSSFGNFGLCVTTTTNDDCANALYICDPNGYSGSTSPAYTPDRPSNMHGNNETSAGVNLPNGTDSGGPFGDGQPWDMSYSFNGSPALDVNIENNSWIKFTASAATVVLNVDIYDCWVGNYPSGGMQMQIFEANNCTNFIPVSNFAESSSGFTLTANGLTVGQDYYLMIDGYAGDICNYTISANSGVQFPDITPSNPTICQGDAITLTAPPGATSYYWPHSGETTQIVTVNPPTTQTYVCEVTGLCSYKQTLTAVVTVNQTPNLTGSGVTSNSPICSGQNAIFTITGTPGAVVTYDFGGANQTITLNAAGTETITVPNVTSNQTIHLSDIAFTATTCNTPLNVFETVVVNALPNVVANASSTSICTGQSVTLTGSGANSYVWNNGVTNGVPFNPSSTNTYTVTGTDANGCSNINNITVNVNPLPNVVANASSTSICTGQSVTLTGSGANSYVWNNGVTNGVPFNPSSTNTYTVTGTDVNGCQNTDNVTVTITSAPTFTSITNNSPICSGENAIFTLTGSPNATITYSINGNPSQTTTTDASGNATVTINGATADQTITLSDIAFSTGCNTTLSNASTITVNPNPTFTLVGTDPTSCGGSDGYITISGLNANTNYNVTYNNGGTTVGPTAMTSNGSGVITINGLSQGNYSNFDVGLISTGCNTLNNTTSISLNDPGSPVINSITNTDPTTCSGTDATITISGLTANTSYNVTYNDNGTTVGPSSITTNGAGEIVITGLDAGVYDNFIVEITGCSVADNTTLNISDPNSPNITNVVNSNPTTCGGTDGTITLSGLSPNTTYDVTYDDNGTSVGPVSLTSNGAGDIVINGLDAGTYDNFTVTVPATGCSGNNTTQAVLSDPGAPNITGISNANTTTCGGADGTITISGLTANTSYNLTYDDNGTTVGPTAILTDANGDLIVTGLSAGTYTNFVVELAGCITNDNTSLNIIDPTPPTVDAGNPTMNICEGTSVTLTATNPDGATISWNNGVTDGTAFTPNVGTITYTVTATATNNCVNQDSIEITVNPEPQIDLNALTVVDANCTDGGQVTGVSILNGTPNYSYEWTDGTNVIATTADVSNLSQGNYTLIVTDAQGCDDTTNVIINFVNNAVVIAVNDSASTAGVNEVNINVYPNDTGDETSITVVTQPENGTITDNGNGELTYVPNEGFEGTDSLTYLICDPNCINTCDTATVYIVVDKLDSLIIPNGFTPNGDGFNDMFVIKNLEQYPNNNIIIFNRWGDIVFSAKPYNNDWDGTSLNSNVMLGGDKVVDGTYFFVLDLGEEDKEKISGYIDLRRK